VKWSSFVAKMEKKIVCYQRKKFGRIDSRILEIFILTSGEEIDDFKNISKTKNAFIDIFEQIFCKRKKFNQKCEQKYFYLFSLSFSEKSCISQQNRKFV